MLNVNENTLIFEAYMSPKKKQTNKTAGIELQEFAKHILMNLSDSPETQSHTTLAWQVGIIKKLCEGVLAAPKVDSEIDPENAAQNAIDQAKMDRTSGKASENTAQNKIDSARNKLK